MPTRRISRRGFAGLLGAGVVAVDLHEQADLGAVRESDLHDLADAWDGIDTDLLPYT